MVKNLPANEGNAEDVVSISGLGRSLGGENSNPLQYAWEIPWTEKSVGLQTMGLQRVE